MSKQEKEYLVTLKSQIEEVLGWGTSKGWTNADMEKLSELIFTKTGVSLSISTFKRLFGKVRYNSIPTLSTLNALVQFIGFDSWRTYCSQIQLDEKSKVAKQPLNRKLGKIIADQKWTYWYITIIITFIFISALVYIHFFNTPPLTDRGVRRNRRHIRQQKIKPVTPALKIAPLYLNYIRNDQEISLNQI